MGEEPGGIASGATFDDADVVVTQASLLQLAPVGFDEVEMDFGPQIAMSGSSLIQEQQRIAHMNGVGVEDLFEQVGCIGELRFKFGRTSGPTA